MKVSIVVPTYGRLNDLADLFESILRQSAKPLEVIVIDDTPIPIIEDLCGKYGSIFKEKGINLRYVRKPERPSISVARNIGANIAEGQIILFLDSDVILDEKYIEGILGAFMKYPHAIGVQGIEVSRLKEKREDNLFRSLRRKLLRSLFFLNIYTKDSCKLFEYPVLLTRTINCEWLTGSNMAWRKSIFTQFTFDENLEGYSYMEDVLFSYSVFRKYPRGLLITPKARCIHKLSKETRMGDVDFKTHNRKYRKYVLTKMFGLKGLYIFFMQEFGAIFVRLFKKNRR
jgi:glycosyltransferase involved in cell wall biosynthesis